MARLVICLCMLITMASCLMAISTQPHPDTLPAAADKSDVLTVFLTGNVLGELKPCGCSGGQLGGFDRRPAILNRVQPSRRLVVDTGSFTKTDSEQDLIKFNIVIQALGLLEYDLVNLSKKDIDIAGNLHLLESMDSVFNIISPQSPADVNVPAKFTKRFPLKEKTVTVTVVSFDPESTPIERLKELFMPQPDTQTLNILILSYSSDTIIDSITKMQIVDCLICPAESDEPMVIGSSDKRPLVVSAGRLGKYIGRLRIEAKNKLNLDFSAVPVTENLPHEQSLIELYKVYQLLVREADLLEKHPRFPLSDGLKYTGSKSCKLCHDYEYQKWSTKGHAHAYATLEKVGSQFDPECIVCHVVGFEYESGFVSQEKSGEDLKNVGCENCHGPGSEHITTLGKAKTTMPMADCLDCHAPENSADYAANEMLYFEKIIHWREPNEAGSVE